MALGDYVQETKERRTRTLAVAQYGDVVWHGRVVTMPDGRVDTEFADALAIGTVMPDRFYDTAITDSPLAPKLTKIAEEWTGAKRVFVLQYLELKGGTVTNGYSETARKQSNKPLRNIYSIWGISAVMTSTGIPARDDYLDGVSGLDKPQCINVEMDAEQLPGRVLVHSTWAAARTYA